MRAAIYVRISQDRTGEEYGVDRQREQCRTLALTRGWDVVEVYTENDVSAAGAKARPEWEAMMALVEAGQIDVVIGWTFDRTLRSGRDRLRMLESGKRHKLLITLVRGSDMDLGTPAGRLAADILGAVALNEIEAKADRQKAAHAQAATQGRRIGGRRPFGYEQDGVTVREVEAEAVKAAYRDFIVGTSLSAIARRWNEAGLTSGVPRKDGKGERWEHVGVRHLMKNPRYRGVRRHQPRGQEAQLYPAAWPALVDEATWRAANALLASAQRGPNGGRQLLTGVIRCAVCDELLTGGGSKTGERMYRCPSGAHVTRRAEPVDDQVCKLMRARLRMRDAVDTVAVKAQAGPDYGAEATAIRAEQKTIAKERAQKVITAEQFAVMNTELKAQLVEAERRLADAGRVDAVAALLADPNPAGRFDTLDRDQQRVIIAAFLRIRLHSGGRGVRRPHPDTVQPEWIR